MTGQQLRTIRESRGLTRKEFAEQIGDCTASTLNKWEIGINPVPAWVEERCFRDVQITLPLVELHALLDLARERKQSFTQLLSAALHNYLRAESPQHHAAKAVVHRLVNQVEHPPQEPQARTGKYEATDFPALKVAETDD